jgi:hypothetical protein
MHPVHVLPTETLSVLAHIAAKLLQNSSSDLRLSKRSKTLLYRLCDPCGRLLPVVWIMLRSMGFVETCETYVCEKVNTESVQSVLSSIEHELGKRNLDSSGITKPNSLKEQLNIVRAERRAQFMSSLSSQTENIK